MTQQTDFLENRQGVIRVRYPETSGFKKLGTSQVAAQQVDHSAKTLREQVLNVLKTASLTPDEIAERLAKSVLTIRPRCSELLLQGKIVETTERRRNASGKLAAVLQITRSVPGSGVRAHQDSTDTKEKEN